MGEAKEGQRGMLKGEAKRVGQRGGKRGRLDGEAKLGG